MRAALTRRPRSEPSVKAVAYGAYPTQINTHTLRPAALQGCTSTPGCLYCTAGMCTYLCFHDRHDLTELALYAPRTEHRTSSTSRPVAPAPAPAAPAPAPAADRVTFARSQNTYLAGPCANQMTGAHRTAPQCSTVPVRHNKARQRWQSRRTARAFSLGAARLGPAHSHPHLGGQLRVCVRVCARGVSRALDAHTQVSDRSLQLCGGLWVSTATAQRRLTFIQN